MARPVTARPSWAGLASTPMETKPGPVRRTGVSSDRLLGSAFARLGLLGWWRRWGAVPLSQSRQHPLHLSGHPVVAGHLPLQLAIGERRVHHGLIQGLDGHAGAPRTRRIGPGAYPYHPRTDRTPVGRPSGAGVEPWTFHVSIAQLDPADRNRVRPEGLGQAPGSLPNRQPEILRCGLGHRSKRGAPGGWLAAHCHDQPAQDQRKRAHDQWLCGLVPGGSVCVCGGVPAGSEWV